MTTEPLSFFTLDRGTATTAAALISPCDGRFRLLAGGSAPRAVEPEALLEDLVWRVARTDPGLLGAVDHWREWARLEVRTASAPRVCLVAAGHATGRDLEAAFAGAGWEVAGSSTSARPDALAIGELCLDSSVTAVAVGVAEDASADERAALPALWDIVMALASMRDDLAVLACGPFAERPDVLPEDRLHALPAPEPRSAIEESALRDAARRVGAALAHADGGRRAVDGRQGLRASVASLAWLLDRRVDGVEVGAAAGSRTRAHPGGEVGHLVSETAALVPARVMRDDREAEAILRWSTLRGDPGAHSDRLRNLRLAAWREASGDGARLRLAALRAALSRMDATWSSAQRGPGEMGGAADLVLLSGGAFSAVPAPAAALAVVDTMRRPGAFAILHDHARVLGPIGMLHDEGDRRRLLADLLDDALVPLGSAILTGELRMVGRAAGLMLVSTSLSQEHVPLVPGTLRLVDLPPGITARVDVQTREGALLGTRARRVSLEVAGGLAGLIVDTREVPLRLPETADRRRGMLAAWEAAAWPGGEA